jgi:uncharacterized membrane protein
VVEENRSGTVAEGEADTAQKAAERLTFFSDAVVAIAITLLAIDLRVPTGSTTREIFASMGEDAFDYLAFFISFIVIGTHWRIHHSIFRHVRRADRPIVQLTLLWLLLVVLTPFFTRVLSGGEGVTFVRFSLYATAQALQLVTMAVMVAIIAQRGWFAPTAPTGLTRRGWVPSLIPAFTFAVSVPAFLLVGSWAFALWAVLPTVLERVLTRTGVVAPK